MNNKTQYNKPKMNKSEFLLTHTLLDLMDIEFEDDYTLTHDYTVLTYNGKHISLPDNYTYMSMIPKDKILFRPFKSDKHANIIIDMFDDIFDKQLDSFEIIQNENKLYNGYFLVDGKKLLDSEVENIKKISILKCMCVAKLLMDDEDFSDFIETLEKI